MEAVLVLGRTLPGWNGCDVYPEACPSDSDLAIRLVTGLRTGEKDAFADDVEAGSASELSDVGESLSARLLRLARARRFWNQT